MKESILKRKLVLFILNYDHISNSLSCRRTHATACTQVCTRHFLDHTFAGRLACFFAFACNKLGQCFGDNFSHYPRWFPICSTLYPPPFARIWCFGICLQAFSPHMSILICSPKKMLQCIATWRKVVKIKTLEVKAF